MAFIGGWPELSYRVILHYTPDEIKYYIKLHYTLYSYYCYCYYYGYYYCYCYCLNPYQSNDINGGSDGGLCNKLGGVTGYVPVINGI